MLMAYEPESLKYELILEEQDKRGAFNIIEEGVLAYNRRYIKNWIPKPFTLSAKDIDYQIIGGIVGERVDIYIKVDWVWVDEKFRRYGIGRDLFMHLEKYAYKYCCRFIQLDTADFQARVFYEKLGFEIVATLPKWVGGYDCYVMQKKL